MATTELLATADGSFFGVVNQDGNTTNLFQSVNDDPAAPVDADYVTNLGGGSPADPGDGLYTETYEANY